MGKFSELFGSAMSDEEKRKKKLRSATGQKEPKTISDEDWNQRDLEVYKRIDAANKKKKEEEESRGFDCGGVKDARKSALMKLKKKILGK